MILRKETPAQMFSSEFVEFEHLQTIASLYEAWHDNNNALKILKQLAVSQYRIYSKANLDEAHLNDAMKGVFKTKWLQQNAPERRAQLSVAAMLNGAFLLCQNQSQC